MEQLPVAGSYVLRSGKGCLSASPRSALSRRRRFSTVVCQSIAQKEVAAEAEITPFCGCRRCIKLVAAEPRHQRFAGDMLLGSRPMLMATDETQRKRLIIRDKTSIQSVACRTAKAGEKSVRLKYSGSKEKRPRRRWLLAGPRDLC